MLLGMQYVHRLFDNSQQRVILVKCSADLDYVCGIVSVWCTDSSNSRWSVGSYRRLFSFSANRGHMSLQFGLR